MPLSALRALLDAAEAMTGDPSLGVHMAVNFPRGIYGVVEFIARNCATVRDGLRHIVRYAALLTNRVAVTFEERGGTGIVEHAIHGEPLATGRHANEFFICALVLQARELAGAPFVPKRVWFAHPERDAIDELVAHLGTREIAFGTGTNGVELAAELLALPIRSADPALLSLLDREAAASLEQRREVVPFIDQVRSAISQQFGTGAPTLGGVAQALGTSTRTLQRRLGEDAVSFRDVVESVREAIARKYLGESTMGLGEIAFRLGYTDVSTFQRAFKRWTGMTPGTFRAR